MATENFYPGTSYPLDPEYGNIYTGFRVPGAKLGATTSIQTANQIQEVSNLLNQGIKNVELSTIKPEVFEMIPKNQLKEVNRLTKLTGTETSLHAPVLDPSGFTQQGWNESNREIVENQFKEVVKRSHELNPSGNIPVTIHASSAPGTEHIPIDKVENLTPEEKKKYEKLGYVPKKMVAVNQETGQFVPLEREERFYPSVPEGKPYGVEEELKIANSSYWDQKLSQLIFYKDRGDELIDKNEYLIKHLMKDLEEERVKPDDLTSPQKKAYNALQNVRTYLDNTRQSMNTLYNQAYKHADGEGREKLKQAANQFKEDLGKYNKTKEIGNISNALQNLINTMHKITTVNPPQIYKPIEDFTKDKASDTISNVALDSYNEFGPSSPIVSVENPPYGAALSTGKDLKNLVEKSRKKFVEKLRKERGFSKAKAEKTAEKLIGVTWDTSHISMMRKRGFDKKQLVKEAKEVAPMVKHVHFNDNFGNTHTDLPPGMGDVPMKEIQEELEKAGFKGKKVFEGGNFFQHFKTSPHPYVLEATGSPLYSVKMQPYWNQIANTYGSYFAYPSAYFPEKHFSIYGGGFSALPKELGGQMPGKQSRFSQTPNT